MWRLYAKHSGINFSPPCKISMEVIFLEKKLTLKEFGSIKQLVGVQNRLIESFNSFSKACREPQMREAFEKLSASATNHKRKLIEALEGKDE